MRLRLAFAALLAVAALPASAHAQLWLSDPRFSEGIGVKVGELELHPGLGAEFGYDSNYFQRADSEDPIDVLRLRVTPSLSLSSFGSRARAEGGRPPRLVLNATAFASYNQIFDAGDSSEDVNRNDVTLGVGASANIAPQSPIGVDLRGDVQRVGEPSNSPDEDFAWDRWAFRVGGGVTWRPGGGLFEWRGGYELVFNYFEQDNFRNYDNLQHRFSLKGRWRFLPRMALIYDGSYTLVRYTETPSPPEGEMVRSRIGINGLVTYRLALSGTIGWMSSFYDGVPQNEDTITATAEAKYFLMAPPGVDSESASTGLSTITAGYSRDMTNSYTNTFYTRDRGYAGITYLLGGVLVLSLEGGFSHYTFPEGTTFDAFSQNRIDARLFAEYRFTNTIGLNGSLRYDSNMSDDLRFRDDPDTPTEDLDFERWQAYIGLRWFM